MPKKLENIPIIKSEDEEREFWANEDSTNFVNWEAGRSERFAESEANAQTIYLRMSESMLNQIRLIANQRDVPYQSLIKMFLKDRIKEELKNS